MAEIIEITDLSHPALTPYARLTEGQLRSRQRPEEGMFIAESQTVVELALRAGCQPVSALMEHSQLTGQAKELAGRIPCPVYTAPGSLLSQLTGFALCRGVLSLMRRPALPDLQTVLANARRVAVLEDIMDGTNVGAIIRSAAALGMDAVLVTPRCADPLLRRAARVSMGTVFQIPWTVIGRTGADWPAWGMETLRRHGFVTAAMALRKDTVSVADRRLREAPRLAVILGTEGSGLSEQTIARCDFTVKIPMYHGVDSLNVAAASAVAFWELAKVEEEIWDTAPNPDSAAFSRKTT